MPTKAKPIKPAINIAHTNQTLPILAFNQAGQVDIFEFDDTGPMAKKFGLDASKQIALPELANANILFQIASQLKLMPGETSSDDEKILKHLRASISKNVHDPEIAVAEIIASWNWIASLDISTPYLQFRTSKEKALLSYQGAYDATLHNYIAGYLATLTRHEQIETWVFMQAAELINSTREGRAFACNPYHKMDSLISLARECTGDIKDSEATITNIEKRLKKEQGPWFVTTRGLIGFEVQEVLTDEAALKKAPELRKTLRNLRDGNFEGLSQDSEIADSLEETIKIMKNPMTPSFYNPLADKPSAAQIRLAIAYTIEINAKEQHFELDPLESGSVRNVLKLAASVKESDAELLLQILLSSQHYVSSMLLEAIVRGRKSDAVRDVAIALLDRQRKEEASLPQQAKQLPDLRPAAPQLTSQYDANLERQRKPEENSEERKKSAPSKSVL